MERAQRRCVKKPMNALQGNFSQENGERSSQQDKKLSVTCNHTDKSTTGKCSIKCQSMHRLEKAVVVLEDIAINSSLVSKRTVLGDKTNRSPMSPSNQKQKNLNRSTDQKNQEKMFCHFPGKINDEVSSNELCDSRKLLSVNKSPLGVVPFKGNLKNQAKSSHFSDKCIYTRVQRETLRNRNMPLEEKLAQYEFEVDENEPIPKKKKKKKNVTRRKKVKSNELYCPPSKVFQKIFQAGIEEAEEKIKGKSKDGFIENLKPKIDCPDENCREQTLGSEVHDNALSPLVPQSNRKSSRSYDEKCREQTLVCEVHDNALSQLVPQSTRKSSRSYDENCREQTLDCEVDDAPLVLPSSRRRSRPFSENLSPVARPGCQNQNRSVRRSGNFGDLEVNPNDSNSIHTINSCEKSLPDVDLDDRVGSCISKEMSTAEARCNNRSDHFKSPKQIGLQSPVHGKVISTPIWNSVKDPRFSLPEVTSASTPVFQSTPLSRNCQASVNVSHSAECSTNHSINFSKRVSVTPRKSGGGNSLCKNVLAENWSVDNCFGFDDGNEESVELSFNDTSSKRRLRNNVPVPISTPVSKKRKACFLKGKENEIPSIVKRKQESTKVVLPNSLPKPVIRHENTSSMCKSSATINTLTEEYPEKELDTSVIQKPSSPATLGLSPYSNPLKQSKLDFLAIQSNTCETPEREKTESPLLFKDSEDKTPVHFKEPARRSYVRSVRRKLRPVGCEWIEIDSESEDERESSHHPTENKRKRVKVNKHEVKKANEWMKDFNRQCEEIEGFELCVEK